MATLDVYPSLRCSPAEATVNGNEADIYDKPFADDAPIWSLYASAAQSQDKALVERWNRGLDTLALFSGLFSALTGAFIIESVSSMQPDYTELTYRAISANISGHPLADQPFKISSASRAANVVWLTSLLLSLSAALIAIMGKDWIAEYTVPERPNIREWSQLRHFRWNAVRQWKMPEIIGFAPILLHVSLLMFAIGLALFLYPIDTLTAYVVVGLSSFSASFYLVTACSPFLYFSSPFRSPSVYATRSVFSEVLSITLRSLRASYSLFTSHGKISRSTARDNEHGGDIESSGVLGIGQRMSDSWSIISRTPATATRLIYSHIISFVYSLWRRWRSEPLDLWHNTSLQVSIERTAADVISSLSTMPMTPEIFNAVIHALKDSQHGKMICAVMSPLTKGTFCDIVDQWDTETGSSIERARLYIAGRSLGIDNLRLINNIAINSKEISADILLCYTLANYFPNIDSIQQPSSSMNDATLMRILELVGDSHGSYLRQLVISLRLLNGFTWKIFFSDTLSDQMAKLLRPVDAAVTDPDYHTYLGPRHEIVTYLCIFLLDPGRYRLSEQDVEIAANALRNALPAFEIPNIHFAYLFSRIPDTHFIWDNWSSDAISWSLSRLPASKISSGRETDDHDYAIDLAVAQSMARLIQSGRRIHSSNAFFSDGGHLRGAFNDLLGSFIPASGVSSSVNMRKRVYHLLDIASKGHSFYPQLAILDNLTPLLSKIAEFIACDPEPHSADAVGLFNILVSLRYPDEQDNKQDDKPGLACFLGEDIKRSLTPSDAPEIWLNMSAEGIKQLYSGLARLKFEENCTLFEQLTRLRHIYADHECWSEIASRVSTAAMECATNLAAEEKDFYLEFCREMYTEVENTS